MTYLTRQHGWWLVPAWHIVKALWVLAIVIFLRLHPLLSLVPKPARCFPVLCSSPRHQVANQKAMIGSSLSHTLYPHDSILGVSGPREPA